MPSNAARLSDFGSGIGTFGAVLQVDNTNQRIGIGTTNPQSTLQVGVAITMDGAAGVITATSFSGDGSSLTGVASTENIITGTAATFNNVVKVGTAITLDATSGIITAVNGFVGDVTGNVTGNISGATGSFTGNVSVGGTLTYEDVTNIDSIGIVTARSGIEFGAAGVGGTITAAGQAEFAGNVTALGVNVSGIVTAASFQGSGADLTNLPASGDSNDITASLFL